MTRLWALVNERGSWLVGVGTRIEFFRETICPAGPNTATGIIDAPVRQNAYGMVTHLKVKGVDGEAKPILVPVRNITRVEEPLKRLMEGKHLGQ